MDRPISHKSNTPVVIIGAGLSGLACAVTLHQKGVPFLLLESSSQVGGALKTDEVDGHLLDQGFQVYLTAYTEGQRFFGKNSIPVHHFMAGAQIYTSGKFHTLLDPLKHPTALFQTLLSPIGTVKDKLLMAVLIIQNTFKSINAIFNSPESETRQYLSEFGFSQSFREAFLHPFLKGVFLDERLDTSSRMANFVLTMFANGYAALPKHGMAMLPKHLYQQLPSEQIRLNTSVKSIDQRSIILESGEVITADCIVIATKELSATETPFPTDTLEYRSVGCLYFSAPKSPTAKPILTLNGTGTGPINNLAVPSDVSPHYAPAHRALISVSVVKPEYLALPETELIKQVQGQLIEWYGNDALDWKHLKTYSIPKALPAYKPGNPPKNKPYRQITPNIYLCGDHMASPSIQGALESGRLVAEAIIQANKVTT